MRCADVEDLQIKKNMNKGVFYNIVEGGEYDSITFVHFFIVKCLFLHKSSITSTMIFSLNK